MPGGRRLTIVQYAGDMREAALRLSSGGQETYRGQNYTVSHVEGLARRLESVTTITLRTEERFDTVLPSGMRAIGAGFNEEFDAGAAIPLVEVTKPDLLILHLPSTPLIHWARRKRVRTLMLLADSFSRSSLRRWAANMLLARQLNSQSFDVVANHGRRASQQLVAMGVDPAKVIAWDYPPFHSPAQRPAKSAPGDPAHLLYVGLLIPAKGIDDLIGAVKRLHQRGSRVTLDIIGGGGGGERLTGLIQHAGLDGHVRLVGQVPNKEIIDRMAQADLVVVPSRHEYSEGMPLTIYEAYCSRTPLIASDHPMFRGNVVDGESGLVFPAGDSHALADKISRALGDHRLYAALSENGAAAWEKLQLPVKWHELVDRWISGDAESRAWLRAHSMAPERAAA